MAQQGTTTCSSFCWKVEGGNGTYRVNDSSRWKISRNVFGIWWNDAIHPKEMLDPLSMGVCVLGPLHWAGLEVTRGDWYLSIVRSTYMRDLVHDT